VAARPRFSIFTMFGGSVHFAHLKDNSGGVTTAFAITPLMSSQKEASKTLRG